MNGENYLNTADEVKINVFIENSKFYVSSEYEISLNDKCGVGLFAFYLLKNGVRIDTIWYTESNKAVFDIKDNGVYKAVCFIKIKEKIAVIKESEELIYYKEVRDDYSGEKLDLDLSIFGSCVSRDILEFNNKGLFNINLKTYLARQSIFSALSARADVSDEMFHLDSSFQKRMVLSDFNKDCFDIFDDNRSKYLMIDLIDERFSLGQYQNSIVTCSSCLYDSKFDGKISLVDYIIKGDKYYLQGFDIDIFLREFCRKVLEIYRPENIIIHKAKMLDFYKDINGCFKKFDDNILRRNRIINKRISYIFEFFEKEFKNSIIIDICDDYYADEKNKWGLAPMHYCSDYYTKSLEILHSKLLQMD